MLTWKTDKYNMRKNLASDYGTGASIHSGQRFDW